MYFFTSVLTSVFLESVPVLENDTAVRKSEVLRPFTKAACSLVLDVHLLPAIKYSQSYFKEPFLGFHDNLVIDWTEKACVGQFLYVRSSENILSISAWAIAFSIWATRDLQVKR